MVKGKAEATQDFVPIKEIRDGVVILKDGTMRMVLLVSSINFALKSTDEQTAILMQFQNFLNSLDFYIQIFVQSRRLDIRPYLRTLEERLVAQTTDLMKVQVREYIEFIRKFTETTDIMSKSFFFIIPYTPRRCSRPWEKKVFGGNCCRGRTSPPPPPRLRRAKTMTSMNTGCRLNSARR